MFSSNKKRQITKRHKNMLSKKITSSIIGNLINITSSNHKTDENSLTYTSGSGLVTVRNNSCLNPIVETNLSDSGSNIEPVIVKYTVNSNYTDQLTKTSIRNDG